MNMQNIRQQKDWPAPDDYLIELGRISALWGTLEHQVNFTISKFAGHDDIFDYRVAILTAHINFKQKLDILGALCDQRRGKYPLLNSYEKVISLIMKAQAKRNKYMHNGLSYNRENQKVEIASLSARGKLKANVEEVTLDDLKNVSVIIQESMHALLGLLNPG